MIRSAKIADLSLANRNIHRLQGRFQRRMFVGPVNNVEIDVICLQQPQTAFQLLQDMCLRQPAILWPRSDRSTDFRRQDNAVAAVSQRLTSDLLRHTAGASQNALIPFVHVGRVDEVNPQVKRAMDQINRLGLRNRLTKRHRPQANGRNQQTAVT